MLLCPVRRGKWCSVMVVVCTNGVVVIVLVAVYFVPLCVECTRVSGLAEVISGWPGSPRVHTRPCPSVLPASPHLVFVVDVLV
jgi:hypothetical protein